MGDMTHDTSGDGDLFPQDVSGLSEARSSADVTLGDGDVLPLRIGPVRKTERRRSE
jgi:hypothetical protein